MAGFTWGGWAPTDQAVLEAMRQGGASSRARMQQELGLQQLAQRKEEAAQLAKTNAEIHAQAKSALLFDMVQVAMKMDPEQRKVFVPMMEELDDEIGPALGTAIKAYQASPSGTAALEQSAYSSMAEAEEARNRFQQAVEDRAYREARGPGQSRAEFEDRSRKAALGEAEARAQGMEQGVEAQEWWVDFANRRGKGESATAKDQAWLASKGLRVDAKGQIAPLESRQQPTQPLVKLGELTDAQRAEYDTLEARYLVLKKKQSDVMGLTDEERTELAQVMARMQQILREAGALTSSSSGLPYGEVAGEAGSSEGLGSSSALDYLMGRDEVGGGL